MWLFVHAVVSGSSLPGSAVLRCCRQPQRHVRHNLSHSREVKVFTVAHVMNKVLAYNNSCTPWLLPAVSPIPTSLFSVPTRYPAAALISHACIPSRISAGPGEWSSRREPYLSIYLTHSAAAAAILFRHCVWLSASHEHMSPATPLT